MKTNNTDKYIADKFKDRELKVSPSAWERLNIQLDKEERKKKKRRILYLSYAASVTILIGLGFFYQNSNKNDFKEIIVKTSLDTIKIKKIDLNNITLTEEAIVKITDTKVDNKENSKNVKKEVFKKYKERKKEVIASLIKEPAKRTTVLKDIELKPEAKTPSLLFVNTEKKKVFNSRIKINSDDLLFSVTHTSDEIKEYYAKYKIKRKDVIETIQRELIKSDLKINPELILAEVEQDIEESDFQQNFMNKFKLKLSDVIVAIADRNK